jgi:hypothetical protein
MRSFRSRPRRNEVVYDPFAGGPLTSLEKEYIDFWFKQRRHRLRRHNKPFNKTSKGLQRRAERRFKLEQREA